MEFIVHKHVYKHSDKFITMIYWVNFSLKSGKNKWILNAEAKAC